MCLLVLRLRRKIALSDLLHLDKDLAHNLDRLKQLTADELHKEKLHFGDLKSNGEEERVSVDNL